MLTNSSLFQRNVSCVGIVNYLKPIERLLQLPYFEGSVQVYIASRMKLWTKKYREQYIYMHSQGAVIIKLYQVAMNCLALICKSSVLPVHTNAQKTAFKIIFFTLEGLFQKLRLKWPNIWFWFG